MEEIVGLRIGAADEKPEPGSKSTLALAAPAGLAMRPGMRTPLTTRDASSSVVVVSWAAAGVASTCGGGDEGSAFHCAGLRSDPRGGSSANFSAEQDQPCALLRAALGAISLRPEIS